MYIIQTKSIKFQNSEEKIYKSKMGAIMAKRYNKKIMLDQSQFFYLKEKLCLDDNNLQDLYECFRKIDRFDRAYIDFDDFVAYFRNDIENFVQLPFAERLFKMIPKTHETKIFFEEFVQGISAFCLLNNQSILRFIFDYIDTDQDQRISKKDMLKLIHYTDPQNGRQTFFTNFSTEIDQFPMKQKNHNKIDFQHFKNNNQKLSFLIWPAFSLQQYLRENILGIQFWFKLYGKVEKKEIQIKNNQKKQQRMRQKLQILKSLKIKSLKRKQNPNKFTTLDEELIFDKSKINCRMCGQSSDDSKLLKRWPQTRRRSTPYIKDQLQIHNIEAQIIQN